MVYPLGLQKNKAILFYHEYTYDKLKPFNTHDKNGLP